MVVYADLVMVLNFAVDFLLLLAANRLCGYPARPLKFLLAAALGGLYSGLCLLPEFRFLGDILWRTVSFGAMCLIAFGVEKSTVRRGVLFALLQLALSGAALGVGKGTAASLLVGAAAIGLLCLLGFCGTAGGRNYIPVELGYGGRRVRVTALRDTGNTLRDPVTGNPVLVVSADTALRLTGLSKDQLRNPLDSLGALPGLRLIPYRTVGSDGGLLLALKLPYVRIGSWKGSSLVAFAPEGLDSHGVYQALTGGTV